ncbi:MAG: dihydrolipoamide dehydrogenase [Solirubrobacteraceae bacterium]|jgi:dihydrolipoamide dehydrogenase|nr:dihydrolipoamide dehydrogenase [Solirubrobacteraceae bacterium]
MADLVEVKVPDIGDFADVPVIEVLVSAGDEVAPEDPLVTLESDKATMDIPAPAAGTVTELKVAVGDTVSQGSLLLLLAPAAGDGASPDAAAPAAQETPAAAARAPASAPDADVRVQVAVLGAGPGGYTAAFRAADLGLQVALIDRGETLGGVCLNVGCIPSKALLHVARVLAESEELSASGVSFARPEIDVAALRGWKESVVARLTGGLAGLARQRKVEVIRGAGRLTGPNVITVQTPDGETTVGFEHCILASGSSPAWLPDLPDDERVMDSTGALDVTDVPERLLVVGGGIIGLEMATVYDALGSRVTVVELMDQLIPGCDPDLVKPLHKRIAARYEAIHLGTRVDAVSAGDQGLTVSFAGEDVPEAQTFDRVLVAVGRRPNGAGIGAEAAGVEVDDRGFIAVDRQMRTNVGHVFAIGDVVGEPMLAHKATHEAKVAAEVIAGEDVRWDARSIPNVAYTDPEIAWTGLTETRARDEGIAYEKASFPWAASGRSLAQGRDDGLTKLLVEPGTRRLLGAGIVGPNAGELIAEAVHAIEVGSDAQDLGLTIHPHPTLSETLGFAAEMADGTITDLMPPRARRTSTSAAG